MTLCKILNQDILPGGHRLKQKQKIHLKNKFDQIFDVFPTIESKKGAFFFKIFWVIYKKAAGDINTVMKEGQCWV